MSDRVQEELELLRGHYDRIEYLPQGRWVLIRDYQVPAGIWNADKLDVSFQIPERLPGQAPYAFYVRGDLRLHGSNDRPTNYDYPVGTGFGAEWGRFSWQLNPWRPGATAMSGTNLLNFAQSFRKRLEQGQ